MTSTKSSTDMLRVIVPLDQCQTSNGTVLVVPSSHMINDELVFEENAIDIGYCNKNNKAVNLMPGDILGFSSKLIHGSGMNKSNLDRNILIFQFIVKGAEHIYEDKNEPFHNISIGDIRSL